MIKRMNRKQYIEKLQEHVRELYDIDHFTLLEFMEKAKLNKNQRKQKIVFISGMEQGLEIAIKVLEDL